MSSKLAPLPHDILSLPPDETACSFCGISYLLAHKYETLSKHVEELNMELETLREFKEERPGLLTRIDILNGQARESAGIHAEMHVLRTELAEVDGDKKRVVEEYERLKEDAGRMNEEREAERNKEEKVSNDVRDAARNLKMETKELRSSISDTVVKHTLEYVNPR
jgi:chromosome segregation ATPase